jgi:hypothetical protein
MHVLYPLLRAHIPVVGFPGMCSYPRRGQCPNLEGRCLYCTRDVDPNIVASLWYGMSMILCEVSQDPIATARDFPMFTFAPVASSQQCRVSCIVWMSVGDVTSTVTLSAYAITDVLSRPLPMRSPDRCLSSVLSNGFRQMSYSNILIGHLCLTELFIGMGLYRKPFICTADDALLYIFWIRRQKCSLKPCSRCIAIK